MLYWIVTEKNILLGMNKCREMSSYWILIMLLMKISL